MGLLGWGYQISRQSAHESGKIVSPTHQPPYSPRKFLVLISVRGWVDLRAIVQPEGLCQWRIPMTPSGIKPVTFWLVAQCLNQLRHHVPPKVWLLLNQNHHFQYTSPPLDNTFSQINPVHTAQPFLQIHSNPANLRNLTFFFLTLNLHIQHISPTSWWMVQHTVYLSFPCT